jgi:hypothetical protein
VLAFALLIGVVALPGAFLARAIVERMPVFTPRFSMLPLLPEVLS